MSLQFFKPKSNHLITGILLFLSVLTYGDNGSYSIKKGDNLWTISEVTYGNRHYSKIVELYNNIDGSSLKIGQTINIPDLEIILNDKKMGLVPVIKNEIATILKARKLYMEIEKELAGLRAKSGSHSMVILPTNIKEHLTEGGALIDKAIDSIRKLKNVQTPLKMIGQLKQVSENLKKLSSGANDGYGYDMDMVHQNLIQAFYNGIQWAKNGYK